MLRRFHHFSLKITLCLALGAMLTARPSAAQEPTTTQQVQDQMKGIGAEPAPAATPSGTSSIKPANPNSFKNKAGQSEDSLWESFDKIFIADGKWIIGAASTAGGVALWRFDKRLTAAQKARVAADLSAYRVKAPGGFDGNGRLKAAEAAFRNTENKLAETLSGLDDSENSKRIRDQFGGEVCALTLAKMRPPGAPGFAVPAVSGNTPRVAPTPDEIHTDAKEVAEAYKEYYAAYEELAALHGDDFQRVMGRPLYKLERPQDLQKQILHWHESPQPNTQAMDDGIKNLWKAFNEYEGALNPTPAQRRSMKKWVNDTAKAMKESGVKGTAWKAVKLPFQAMGAGGRAAYKKGPQLVALAALTYLTGAAYHKASQPTEHEETLTEDGQKAFEKKREKELELFRATIRPWEDQMKVLALSQVWVKAVSEKQLPPGFRPESLPYIDNRNGAMEMDLSTGALDHVRSLLEKAADQMDEFPDAKSPWEIAWTKVFAEIESKDVQPGKKPEDLEQEAWKKYKPKIQAMAAATQDLAVNAGEGLSRQLKEAVELSKKPPAPAAAPTGTVPPAATPTGTAPPASPTGTAPTAAPTGTVPAASATGTAKPPVATPSATSRAAARRNRATPGGPEAGVPIYFFPPADQVTAPPAAAKPTASPSATGTAAPKPTVSPTGTKP